MKNALYPKACPQQDAPQGRRRPGRKACSADLGTAHFEDHTSRKENGMTLVPFVTLNQTKPAKLAWAWPL